jgi:hypothetical protein
LIDGIAGIDWLEFHGENEMTVRPPRNFSQAGLAETGFNVLEYELMAERASALGRTGSTAEAALAALAKGESSGGAEADHEKLVQAAADAVWALFIQREICGLRNGRDVVARYGIPNKVLVRLGAAPAPRPHL